MFAFFKVFYPVNYKFLSIYNQLNFFKSKHYIIKSNFSYSLCKVKLTKNTFQIFQQLFSFRQEKYIKIFDKKDIFLSLFAEYKHCKYNLLKNIKILRIFRLFRPKL